MLLRKEKGDFVFSALINYICLASCLNVSFCVEKNATFRNNFGESIPCLYINIFQTSAKIKYQLPNRYSILKPRSTFFTSIYLVITAIDQLSGFILTHSCQALSSLGRQRYKTDWTLEHVEIQSLCDVHQSRSPVTAPEHHNNCGLENR